MVYGSVSLACFEACQSNPRRSQTQALLQGYPTGFPRKSDLRALRVSFVTMLPIKFRRSSNTSWQLGFVIVGRTSSTNSAQVFVVASQTHVAFANALIRNDQAIVSTISPDPVPYARPKIRNISRHICETRVSSTRQILTTSFSDHSFHHAPGKCTKLFPGRLL